MGVFLQNHNICRRYQMPKGKGRAAVSGRAQTKAPVMEGKASLRRGHTCPFGRNTLVIMSPPFCNSLHPLI